MSSRPARVTGAHVATCEKCQAAYGKRKQCFLTRADAKRAMRRPGMVRGHGLHAYECPCGTGYWHLGHSDPQHRAGDNPHALGIAQINAMARAMRIIT